MTSRTSNSTWVVLVPIVASLLVAAFWLASETRDDTESLVVYCAHDSVYADQVLNEFEQATGIRVDVRYDTEATKSLGLINLIVQERRQPRCDVFWNNELLGTLDLQSQGLLEPYRGTAWKRLPDKYRDPEGHWVGFAARLRVVIVNTRQVTADETTIQNIVSLETSRAAVAKPLFGTTLTHYTALWHAWGPDRLKAWHQELRARGIREMSGNASVKDIVANGTCLVGLTDTDDVYVAIDDGLPVDMLPARIELARSVDDPVSALSVTGDESTAEPLSLTYGGERGRTICIPNSAAIIRGTRHRDAARKLIDFLASAETEMALAASKARQVPLGPVDETKLTSEVRRMKTWADDGFDLRPLLPARRECLQWLTSEYLK